LLEKRQRAEKNRIFTSLFPTQITIEDVDANKYLKRLNKTTTTQFTDKMSFLLAGAKTPLHKQQMIELSQNFDEEKEISIASHNMLDEKIMNVYDKTLDKMETMGVGWDPKKVKKRKLMNMLNDIEKLNGSVSSMVMNRFNLEMTLRREKLAFSMDKKYNLKRF